MRKETIKEFLDREIKEAEEDRRNREHCKEFCEGFEKALRYTRSCLENGYIAEAREF